MSLNPKIQFRIIAPNFAKISTYPTKIQNRNKISLQHVSMRVIGRVGAVKMKWRRLVRIRKPKTKFQILELNSVEEK